MKKIRRWTVLLVLSVVFFFGGRADSVKADHSFVYIRPASTTSLDLHQEITENNAFAIDKIFEPLVMFDEEGAVRDWLAASHEISEDGLRYTFVLRGMSDICDK